MSKSFEQIAAEGLTTAAIVIGASSTAVKLARAKAALSVAGYFQTLSTGNMASATEQLGALITGIKDPGISQTVSDLVAIGEPFISAEAQALELTPIVGSEINTVLASVATGMSSIANSYIAAYTAQGKAAASSQAQPAAPAASAAAPLIKPAQSAARPTQQ
jgi:hypothetical protein